MIRFPRGLDDLVSSLLSQHLRNGDPSLERCAASASPKRLKDQQGPHLVKPGSKQPSNTSSAGVFFIQDGQLMMDEWASFLKGGNGAFLL